MKKPLLFTFFFILGCFMANAQWNNDPEVNNLITPLGAGTYAFDLQVSKDGSTFVSYVRPMGGNIASLLQIIDKDGNMMFSDEGLTVSHKNTISWTAVGDLMFLDRDGNAIIAVTDCRNAEHATDDVGYSLYKVSPTGEMLWGEDGIDLSGGKAYNLVACMAMTQLEDGSYVCAWSVTVYIDELHSRTHIQLQRISPTGELLWKEEEMRLYNSSFDYEYPYLVSAGNNQVILMFVRGAGRILTAKKIDFDGSNVWAEDVTIYSGGFTIPPLYVILKIIPDQMGGAFVGWYDDRNWENKESTYVAHLTAEGRLGFASGEGGEKIGYNEFLRGFQPQMYFDKEEGFLYIVWRETSQGQSWQQITAQKMKIPSGELMWDPNGIEIVPLIEQSVLQYSIQSDGNGNMALFFSSSVYDPEYYYSWDVNSVTLFDPKGEYVWKDEIVQFATFPSMKDNLVSTPPIDNNFWITAWSDERKIDGDPGGSKKIYLQRVNIDGTLGDNGISVKENKFAEPSFTVIPTVVNRPAQFYISTEKAGKADISLYSIMGQKMETIFSGMLQNGNNTISWNPQKSRLSNGVYIATLTTDTGKKSLRIIVQ